jgi:tetratricopeptide (TPR) repeat protein
MMYRTNHFSVQAEQAAGDPAGRIERRRRARGLAASLLLLGLLLPLNGRALNQSQDGLGQSAQVTVASEPARRAFQEGRDLIADGQWTKAAEKFNEVIVKYPASQDVDASLYWLAFALKKQDKFQLADETIGQLIFKFPQSPWIKDAMSMRIEMSFNLSKFEFASNNAAASDDEARVIALKNVFRADAEQGIATATDILKPGSTASRTLKEAAITLIGLSEKKSAPAILMGIARNEPDLRLRKAAIMALRWAKDEAVTVFLKDLLLSAETDDIALSALFIVSEQPGRATQDLLAEASRSAKLPRVRQEAVVRLGQQGDGSIDKLMEIYRGSTDVEIKRQVPLALARTRSSRAQASLYELACTADDVEVRKRAAHAIQPRTDAEMIAALSRQYDLESAEAVKGEILFALSRSSHKRALQKLAQVAREDPSEQMRKKAASLMAQSGDADAARLPK